MSDILWGKRQMLGQSLLESVRGKLANGMHRKKLINMIIVLLKVPLFFSWIPSSLRCLLTLFILLDYPV